MTSVNDRVLNTPTRDHSEYELLFMFVQGPCIAIVQFRESTPTRERRNSKTSFDNALVNESAALSFDCKKRSTRAHAQGAKTVQNHTNFAGCKDTGKHSQAREGTRPRNRRPDTRDQSQSRQAARRPAQAHQQRNRQNPRSRQSPGKQGSGTKKEGTGAEDSQGHD